MSEGFILHGTIIYSQDPEHLKECPDSYVVCKDGYSEGVFRYIPDRFRDYPVEDFWDKLIIPGMTDLFCAAPAFQIRGMNLDQKEASVRAGQRHFVTENIAGELFAERAYDMLVDSLYIGATTRAVLSADSHIPSVLKLMDLMDESGLISCAGMVPKYDVSAKSSSRARNRKSMAERAADWINACMDRYERTSPILMLPDPHAANDEDLRMLEEIGEETGLPAVLLPDPSSEPFHDPLRLRREPDSSEDKFFFVSCPGSELAHINDSAEFSPLCQYLSDGKNAGLGSGYAECGTDMMQVVRQALLTSKIRKHLIPEEGNTLTLEEAFFLATAGGGAFFGPCGSFEKGNQFDAVILDDQICDTMVTPNPRERLERMVYLSDDRNVIGKYVFGDKLY